MELELECDDNDLDVLHHLPSAPPSTPNSNMSSPPIGNDETSFHSQSYLQGATENADPLQGLIAGMDAKMYNSKRGPGRPRKDLPPQKGIQKRKTIRDQQQYNDRIGFPIAALSSSESSNTGYPDDKIPQNVDELANMENYPGKLCCFCNLSERSALGQGDFLRWEAEPDNCDKAMQYYNENKKCSSIENLKSITSDQVAYRRQKYNCKGKLVNNDCFNELDKIGHIEMMQLRSLLDNAYIYLHRMCLMWSQGVGGKTSELKSCIELVIAKSLMQKCSFCGQYGASITCKMSCTKVYHLPCAAASGSFLIMENFTTFCFDHMEQVLVICPDANIACHHCSTFRDISKMIMCSTCGEHFHTDCVGLVNTPETRTGWNCPNCSKCQICREGDGNEGRFIKCEQCHRLYHTTCLRPIISSLPKYGWKCNRCRVCTDCGSRTPGGGTSSRWHCHYTICDSCYQQRNKGFSCPICHKAYRAAAYKEMVKCNLCHRFVHSTCDDDADLATYHKKKEINPDYDYICPQCKLMPFGERVIMPQNHPTRCSMDGVEAFPQGADDNFIKEIDVENYQKDCGNEFGATEFQSSKIFRKKILFKDIPRGRSGKIIGPKSNVLTHFGRKRNTVRGKGRQLLLNNVNSPSNADRAVGSSRTSDDTLSMERKILLCSAKDKFILSQDLCVMCGSVGLDKESYLIACAQCGQCYHPYCVNTKLSNVILERGWRCLDCTVCESCGQRNDEARLILCDECDLSYHIYCVSPPLETVPHGNWKCKWCAACQKCGRYSPGVNHQSHKTPSNSLLECGQCSSQEACSVCVQRYIEGELIIQCKNCERWLHCRCDSIKSEEEAQICDNIDYHCLLCRPKDKSIAQFLASKSNGASTAHKSNASNTAVSNKHMAGSTENSIASNTTADHNDLEATFWVDGVSMSERGANMIKALSTEIKRKRKMRTPNDAQTKESGILAAIESVVAGSNMNIHSSLQEGDIEAESLKKNLDQFKDGMIWMGADNSPPEGFSISTNDEGVSILRKKRQRNLQKLGIGGFSVRNRALKKDTDESALIANNCSLLESDKRKKVARKKVKSRLSEAYPAYLQEAFFGKSLLEMKSKSQLSIDDSDISDELVDVGDALFHEDKSDTSPKMPTTLPIDTENIIKDQNPLKAAIHSFNIKEECDRDNDKPAIIANSTEVGGPQTIKLGDNPIDHRPIASPFIETKRTTLHSDEKVKPVGFLADAPNESCDATSTPKGQLLVAPDEYGIKHMYSSESQPTADYRAPIAHPQQTPEVNLLANNSTDNLANVPFGVQQTPLSQGQDQSTQIVPLHLQINNLNGKFDGPVVEKSASQTATFTQQLPKSRVTNDMSVNTYFKPTAPQLDSAGTQKTAEKMRRDEDLGEMATISAVLYANTQHPELKQIYPNWNDRCKQILKRWRSLSNEKKAPFLQQAKDNRSALRMRRSQQDQERICFTQKTLKEQEQERIWKQHQAKAKEQQNNLTYTQKGNGFDVNATAESCPVEKRALAFNADILQSTPQPYASRNLSEQPALMSEVNETQTENKHLRTLFLKEQQQQQLRTTTADPWISNSMPINSPKNIFQPPLASSQKLNSYSQSERKNHTFEESKNMQSLELVQLEQTGGNEIKQIFKCRKDMRTTDSGDSELEKLDSDENGGFGDILGGLGDGNDDDLLKSLTAEIGDDFNILEYADPALDELASSQNLLNKLDFEYNDKAPL